MRGTERVAVFERCVLGLGKQSPPAPYHQRLLSVRESSVCYGDRWVWTGERTEVRMEWEVGVLGQIPHLPFIGAYLWPGV